SGPLAHPVDRAVDPGGARSHRGNRRRCREPEVVVAVEVDGNARSEPSTGGGDEVLDRLRRRDPEGVDDHGLPGAGVDRPLVRLLEEGEAGARAVDAEEGDRDPFLGCEGDGGRDPVEHRVARDAERVELQVAERRLDHAGPDAELDECLDVRSDGAREAPDLGAQAGVADQLDRAPVVVRDARKARLDPVDAERVEAPRQLELLLGVEHDADGLLAVAERRVVEADGTADPGAVVDGAGPDEGAVESHGSSLASRRASCGGWRRSPRSCRVARGTHSWPRCAACSAPSSSAAGAHSLRSTRSEKIVSRWRYRLPSNEKSDSMTATRGPSSSATIPVSS